MYSLRIRAPLVAQVAGVIPNVLAPPLQSLRHAGERFQVFANFLHRVSLATMAEVKKIFCDDRIAVRQLVSHIHLAGTARACQRKPPEESSVLVGCQEDRDAICSLRFATLFSCYYLLSIPPGHFFSRLLVVQDFVLRLWGPHIMNQSSHIALGHLSRASPTP